MLRKPNLKDKILRDSLLNFWLLRRKSCSFVQAFDMSASHSAFPNVKKCLLCIDLKLGVLMYVTFEMSIWAFLSFMALENESEFFHNYDLYKFEEHIDDNWYYQMIFGSPEEEDYDYEEGCEFGSSNFCTWGNFFSFHSVESAIEDTDGIDIEYRCKTLKLFSVIKQICSGIFFFSFSSKYCN